MNNTRELERLNKPHARGDEPSAERLFPHVVYINPTHVGMNRASCPSLPVDVDKPHARGDEPGEDLL